MRSYLFCPDCHTYFPSGLRCRGCRRLRAPLETPAQLEQPLWKDHVPGGVATRMALTTLEGQAVLAVPWNVRSQKGRASAPEGGVTLLRLADGGLVWTARAPIALEGGAACANDLVLVGFRQSGIGPGQGWIAALELVNGQERWRQAISGAVRCAPVADDVRVFAGASDGAVYCFNLEDGRLLWRTPVYPRETHIPAPPLVLSEHGLFQALIVATYGGLQGWEDGKVVALDERGKKIWETNAVGNVRGAPVLADGVIYLSAFGNSPSVGILQALDARTGKPRWEAPFKIQGQPSDQHSFNFVGSPLIYEGRAYVGSLNQRLYILEAESGALVDALPAGGGIVASPAVIEGLVVFNTKDGYTHAVDARSGETAWTHPLGAECLTDPLVYGENIFIGADQGDVLALPWHNGRYAWAANRLEAAGRHQEAGDLRALQANFSPLNEEREVAYLGAEASWIKAGEPERAARMWEALNRKERVAAAYLQAGKRWQTQDCARAAGYFQRAASLFFNLRQREAVEECARDMASCANLPYVLMQPVNVRNFIQWEQGEFTLRLINDSSVSLPDGVRLWLGGALQSAVEADIKSPMAPGQTWNIPLTVVPTRLQSALEVEIEYHTGDAQFPTQRGMLAIPIEAEPPREQHNVTIGDVGMIQLTIAGATAEGLHISTRDVGLMRSSAEISSVSAEDIGAVTAGGEIGQVQADGDVGVVRGARKLE